MILRLVFSLCLGFFSLFSFAASEDGMLKNPNFWLAVAFVVFVVLTLKPIKTALFSMLDSRIAEVETALKEASQLKEEALEMRAQAERAQHEAIEESKRLIEYAQKDAELIYKQGQKDLEKAIEKKKTALEQRIKLMEGRALASLRSRTAEISEKALNKLIEDNFTDADDDALIAETIQQLPELIRQN